MSKKILINGITLENGNIIPLLLKIKKWQSLGTQITIFSNLYLKERIDELNMIGKYDFIELKGTSKIKGKIHFMLEALKRNFIALFYVRKIKKQKFDAVYSISSVLDLILFPYVLKKFDKKIKWIAIFDNLVPLDDPGDKLIRVLAWIFFRTSLFFLKKVDHLFTVSDDLKKFLIEKGFNPGKITVTGNAVEIDLIKEAKKPSKYEFDALFIGRINETKGIYDMLKVLEIVVKKNPNFTLAIMGVGDEKTESYFKEKIASMNLKENIIFLGYKMGLEKFNIIKSSKCFLFLSVGGHESFGIALLEAVCCGLPAFAYNLPPFKNIYKNNEVMIFNKHDYKSVADAVLKLFEKGEFNNENGRMLIDKYSWDDFARTELNSIN